MGGKGRGERVWRPGRRYIKVVSAWGDPGEVGARGEGLTSPGAELPAL